MYPLIQMMALGSRNKYNFLSKTPSFLSSLWIQVEGMSKAKQVDLAREGITAAVFQKHGVECFQIEGCGWLAFEDKDGERGMWLAVVL